MVGKVGLHRQQQPGGVCRSLDGLQGDCLVQGEARGLGPAQGIHGRPAAQGLANVVAEGTDIVPLEQATRRVYSVGEGWSRISRAWMVTGRGSRSTSWPRRASS